MIKRKLSAKLINWWLPIATIIILTAPFVAMFFVWITLKKNIFDNPDFWYGYMGYVGTVILACLALWQNKRYKKLSDDMFDKVNMPDFFNASTVREHLEAKGPCAYNSLTIGPKDTSNCKLIEGPSFLLINQPILCLKPSRFTLNSRNVISDLKDTSINVLSTKLGFTLNMYIPKEFLEESNEYKLEMSFQNIYGTTYSKEMNFTMNEDCDMAINWNCKRANRTEENR